MNIAEGIARGVILPRDVAVKEAMSNDEISQQAIQQMVMALPKVHKAGVRIVRKDKAMKEAVHERISTLAKNEFTDEEYAKHCEEMLVLQAQMLSLANKNKKLAMEMKDLKTLESAINVDVSKTQLEHSTLLEEFERFKAEGKDLEDTAFEQGMVKAENDMALQIPSLENAYFTKSWVAALKAANMPPSSMLFFH